MRRLFIGFAVCAAVLYLSYRIVRRQMQLTDRYRNNVDTSHGTRNPMIDAATPGKE